MASTESPIPQPSLVLTPLVVSLSIITSVILVLVGLHLLHRKLRNEVNNNPAIPQTVQSPSLGVKKEVLDLIPVQSYSEEFHKKFLWNDCSVCLSGLEEGDLVRVLPNCRHGFHVQCIDAWFASHSSCPLCRSEVTVDVEACVVALEVKEEACEGLDDGDGSGHRRSSSMLWSSDFGLMSFREKLGLKRCLSLDSCNNV